jgi:hypothetical protein
MKDVKIIPTNCTGCMAEISLGQATATKYTFGSSLCVKCCSRYSKFDSVIRLNREQSHILVASV